MDREGPAVSEKKGVAAPHPRKKPVKKTRKVEEVSDKLEEPVTDSDSDAAADTQPDAESPTGEAEDTGQKETDQKEELPDNPQPTKQDASSKEKPVVTITKDDITKVIVTKIKKKRDNNEKIGQLLKTYGVAQLSDLPVEKYEAFLADVSQI